MATLTHEQFIQALRDFESSMADLDASLTTTLEGFDGFMVDLKSNLTVTHASVRAVRTAFGALVQKLGAAAQPASPGDNAASAAPPTTEPPPPGETP